MASRNIFRRGSTPLKTVQLADPFTSMVANISKQLSYLQQQKALSALAAGDPDGFLTLADSILKTVTGQEKTVWQDLINKANDKIEETAWSAEVNSGRATLEEFKQHLQDKLSKAQEGSQAAYDVITAIDGVNKGIVARDQAKADQQALLTYTNNNNHEQYAQYLIKKLQTTTDASTYQTIRGQIETLRARTANEEQVSRVRSRGDAMSDYLDGKTSAATAIQKLQELALDPKISATEVSSLQTLVTQIHDREEQKARQASSNSNASFGLNLDVFNANLSTYKTARDAVDKIIAGGGDPSKPVGTALASPLDNLRAAASVLTDQYNVASHSAASQGKMSEVERFDTSVNGIQSHLQAVPGKIDDNRIEAATGSTFAQFNNNLKDMTTAEGRADARVRRIAALSAVAPSLNTPDAKTRASTEINMMTSDVRGDIAKLATTDDLSPKDRRDLQDQYRSYVELQNRTGGTQVSLQDFMSAAVLASKTGQNPDDVASIFASKTGMKLEPQISLFGNNFGARNQFVGQTDKTVLGSDFVKQVSDIADKSSLLDNQARAERLGRQLLATPGGTPFGPPGSPENQILGLTAQDIVEMRRGAGLIGNVTVPADQKPSMPDQPGSMYIPPQRNGPAYGGAGFGGKSPSLSESDLTSYENSTDEMKQEQRMIRESQQQAQPNQPSIEDTLLNTTPPPMDMTMFNQMDQTQQPQPPFDPYAGMDPEWQKAYQFLDSGSNIDIQPYTMPPLPDTNPFQVNLPDISVNPYSGSEGPSPISAPPSSADTTAQPAPDFGSQGPY